jgi:hypothetical protein
MWHQITNGVRRCYRNGSATLALLLVSLAVGKVLGQTEQQGANAKSDDKLIVLAPVDFLEKDRKFSLKTPDGKLEVVYMDLGSDVGLIFRSPYNTVLHSNFKRNHTPTSGEDRNYGVDFGDNKVCTWTLGTDPSQGEKPRHLRGAAGRNGDKWEVSLRIPKSELSNDKRNDSWVTFETFDVSGSELPTVYPPMKHRQEIQRSKLFELVYQLDYDKWGEAALHPCWPPDPPRLSARPENPTYKNVYAGTRVCLAWEFPNAETVNITDFGERSATGRACTDVGSQGTRTFVFQADGECPVKTSVSVQVKSADLLAVIVRGDSQVAHRQYEEALQTYQEGRDQDPDNDDLKDRIRRVEALADQ